MIKRLLQSTLLLAVLIAGSRASGAESPGSVDAETFQQLMSELSNWGRWGAEDERGSLNLITPQKRVAAAGLVKQGVTVSLARHLDKQQSKRNPHPLNMEINTLYFSTDSGAFTDRIAIDYHGMAHSHLDALCHIFHDGKTYNGFPRTLVTERGCEKSSVLNMVEGIVTRGVLVDLTYLKNVTPGSAITDTDLTAWAKKTRVNIQPGDALFIRTGRWQKKMEGKPFAGLDISAVQWLKARNIALIGSDTNLEIWPSPVEGEFIPVHTLLIVAMGIPIFDHLDLAPLRREAERQGRWDFLFMVAPLPVEGGTGSPVNPIAVF